MFAFNDNDRRRLSILGIVATFLPTTAAVAVDSTEYPCTITQSGTGPYSVDIITTGYFAGPAHPAPDGASVLTYGVHTIEARLNDGSGTTVAQRYSSFRIDTDN